MSKFLDFCQEQKEKEIFLTITEGSAFANCSNEEQKAMLNWWSITEWDRASFIRRNLDNYRVEYPSPGVAVERCWLDDTKYKISIKEYFKYLTRYLRGENK